MPKIVNRAYMTTATTGTGTITLGSAVGSFRSFAASGVVDGDVVRYVIEDGDNWEIGSGTYAASGTTLTRAVEDSSSGGTAINLSGTAVVFVTGVTADFNIVRDSDPAVDTNPPNVGAVWVNSTSGSMFVCTDNTVDNNRWREVDGSSVISPSVLYLIVAGGGGGSNYGGGGAGGLLSGEFSPVTGTPYPVVVGGGGTGGTTGISGDNSSVFSLTSIGGGRGGVAVSSPGASGGSGGGGGYASTGNAGGAGTLGQGNDGGAGLNVSGSPFAAGGGGGAGAVGGTGSSTIGGAGGIGLESSITGSALYYAGGGGGGHFSGSGGNALGGLGGGGNGGKANVGQTAGTANTGGGGGGAGNTTDAGANGGSGVVIIRAFNAASATTGSPTVTTDGDFTIYKFTGSGSITF